LKNKEATNNTELVELLVDVSRHTKVHRGGRRFSFSALVVVGDRNGKAGYGYGKAAEVTEARSKATAEAKRKMKTIPLREGRTLHHDIIGRFCSGKVLLRAAPAGKGVIAGGPLRAVFNAFGVSDVVAKSLGSRNPNNMVKAAFAGLMNIESPKSIAKKRSKAIQDIAKVRNS
jgi:small subunit ribosomal protein S5